MTNKVYRSSMLGLALEESLNAVADISFITPQLREKIFSQFDESIKKAFEKLVRSNVTAEADALIAYRLLEGVWTFILNDIKFREVTEFEQIKKLKVVAVPLQKKK